jgi:hypothetical protein
MIKRVLTKIDYLFVNFLNDEDKYNQIFIIGNPRTGSTLLYQIITYRYDLLFINNFICKLSFMPLVAFVSSKILFKKNHNNFKSDYGSTSKYGFKSPSECGRFWYRWFPRNKHFISKKDISKQKKIEIKKTINAIQNLQKKDLVFKNLMNSQRIDLIKSILPNSKFIYINRDELHVCISILKARRKIAVSDSDFWSVKPKNFQKINSLQIHEKIVEQVFENKKQIEKDIKNIPENRVLKIDYNEILNNDLFHKLDLFIGGKTKDVNRSIIFPNQVDYSCSDSKIFNYLIKKKFKNE